MNKRQETKIEVLNYTLLAQGFLRVLDQILMRTKQMIGFNHFSQVYTGVGDQIANQSN